MKNFYELQADADRLISAVASIGYDPDVALCDLIDNSISANAKNIHLLIRELDGDRDENGIDEYWIVDDGEGMDLEGLKLAFGLGTKRTYPQGALGKFGLGLKSAGLSLGRKLTFLTKKKESPTIWKGVLDRSIIKQTNRYGVVITEASQEEIQTWKEFLDKKESGTILLIQNLTEVTPPENFRDFMNELIGLIYHRFIENGIHFFINEKEVKAFDPLFTQEADQNGEFDKDKWDGKTVNWLCKPFELEISGNVKIVVCATNLVHPPSFEPDISKASIRKKYGIGQFDFSKQQRHGFYVYRNNRIIGIAERFHGIVANDIKYFAFRGRIEFDESADDALDLDVKKRHIRLSNLLRNNLKNRIARYVALSAQAWESRQEKILEQRGEKAGQISSREIGSSPIAEASYRPVQERDLAKADSERLEIQEKIAEETLSKIVDDSLTRETLRESAEKKDALKFANFLKGNLMWDPYPLAEVDLVQAVINRNHSWISIAYTKIEEEKNISAIEILNSLLYILARADLEIQTNYSDLEEGLVKKVMLRYRKLVSTLAEEYASKLETRLNEGEIPKDEY